jgi:hypothetical protein
MKDLKDIINKKKAVSIMNEYINKEIPMEGNLLIELINGHHGQFIPNMVAEMFGFMPLDEEFFYESYIDILIEINKNLNKFISAPDGYYLSLDQWESDGTFGLILFKY